MVVYKLIHIVDYPQANPWIENQIQYLSENGIKQGLVSIYYDGELLENLRKAEFKELYKCNFNVIGFFRIGKQIKSKDYEYQKILYAHGHKPSVMAMVLKVVFGFDYVVSHHHPPHWLDMYQEKHKIKGKYHQFLRDKYYKNAIAIQSFSSEVDRYLEGKGVANGKILRIPLGVDFGRFKLEAFDTVHKNRETHELKILTVSRLAWEKRIDLGLEIATELSLLGIDFHYSIIGDGPQKQDLLQKINVLKLSHIVDIVGWVNNIDEYYKNNDILLHLSVTESYGQVLVEARMHGLPVLTTPCGIALNMASTADSDFHVLTSLRPSEVAAEIVRISKIRSSTNDSPGRFKLYEDQEFYKVQEDLKDALIQLFRS